MLLNVVLGLGTAGLWAYNFRSRKEIKAKEEEREERKREREEEIAEEREERKREKKQERALKLRTTRCEEEVQEFEQEWEVRFRSLIVIDSNIWMKDEFSKLFENLEWVMKRFSSSITMSSIQFDEIIKLKDLPYSNPKSHLARCALTRIEYFQKKGMININHMQLEARKYAYADPDIIKLLLGSVGKYPVTTLISDDVELRIRANQILEDKSQTDFLSIGGLDLGRLIKQYRENINFLYS